MQFKYRISGFFKVITQHKRLFFTGLLVKLLLGTFFASDYLVHLFTPFLKYATMHQFTGAYDYFNTYGKGNEFPYPGIMLVVLSIPKFLFSIFSNGDITKAGFADIFSVRMALLFCDLLILFILLQWLKKYSKSVYWVYWLSPVCIYINYVHGQLDVIPISILFISLYFLFKNRFLTSCIFLALAIGCKTSIFLAVPFVFVYAYKNFRLQKNLFYNGLLLFFALLFLINIPALLSTGFRQMVFNNEEQMKLFSTGFPISGSNLFLLVPAVYLLLLIRFTGYWQMSRNLLLMYLGFAFGLITIFIAANQGWYYWCLPFFIYFLIKEYRYAVLPFVLINIFYFVYFAIIPNSDFIRVFQLIDPDVAIRSNLYGLLNSYGKPVKLFVNIASTLLQASLIGFCYFIYRYGISQIQFYKMQYQPYLIGIAGDSATGKTTLAALLQNLFGRSNTTLVSGDDMHKWERGNPNWESVTHLNPKANTLHLNLLHTLQFIKGNAINRQQYSHETGSFTPAEKMDINRIAIFEGLHSFYLEYQKQLFDLKIFMKPDETLRVDWKLSRDVQERGHTEEKILENIHARKQDAGSYIDQQALDADIIIVFCKNTDQELQLQFQCLNHFYMDELVSKLQASGLTVHHEYVSHWQFLVFDGCISSDQIRKVAENYNDTLEDLGFGQVVWKENFDGIIQLLIVQIIFYKMQLSTVTNHSEW
jgi:uridine kinase